MELDPWGGETSHSSNQNQAFQPKKFTSYIRDASGSDDAMHRRYNPWSIRFEQPDPYDGSYDLANPQSFNRYGYVKNDPVNLVDPTGLTWQLCGVEMSAGACMGPDFWGGGIPHGNGWGQDPRPGRRQIDIANNAIDHWRNSVWYGDGSDPWLQITATLCFGGVCWDAGSMLYIGEVFPSEFAVMGGLDSWPPPWPRRVDGYDPRFGWRTQPAPELEQFPRKVGLGPQGVEVRPEFDPEKSPSNASQRSQASRGIISALGKALGEFFSVVGGTFTDVLGPVVMPDIQVKRAVCQQNPNNPGCRTRIPL